jgi:chromosome segregation and condensation protein ScpB
MNSCHLRCEQDFSTLPGQSRLQYEPYNLDSHSLQTLSLLARSQPIWRHSSSEVLTFHWL